MHHQKIAKVENLTQNVRELEELVQLSLLVLPRML
jgi:hypothetical protein